MPAKCIIESTDLRRTRLLLECAKKEHFLFDEFWIVCEDSRQTHEIVKSWDSEIPIVPKHPDGEVPRLFAKQCYKFNYDYVFLSDSIVHFHQGSLENLLRQHRKSDLRVATYMTPLDFPRSGYMLQVMGLLPEILLQPWTENYIDDYIFDHIDARRESHEVYLILANKPHWGDFGSYLFQEREALPESGCCWNGTAMKEIFQNNQSDFTNVSDIFVTLSRASKQSIALCGGAWCANLKKDLEADFLHRYEALAPS